MSRVTLTEGTVPANPAVGKVVMYAKTDGKLYYKDDNGTERPFTGAQGSKSIIVELPTSTEDLSFFFSDLAITITKIRPILVGSSTPSVTWTLRHGADRSGSGSEVVTGGTITTEVSTGVDITSFNDPSVVANSHLWFETTAKSGTVDSISLTIFYTED